jgi:hypothetical protein
MTQQYRYNTETGQFIEDKGNLGISFYEAPWVEATQEQAEAYELQEAKDAKISEMKANRDAYYIKSFSSTKGQEISLNSETSIYELGEFSYFNFRTASTGTPTTEPSAVLSAAINATEIEQIRYSCEIIDDSVEGGTRRGYIALSGGTDEEPYEINKLAIAINEHMQNRTMTATETANNMENEINEATTIEEVDAVDINFD